MNAHGCDAVTSLRILEDRGSFTGGEIEVTEVHDRVAVEWVDDAEFVDAISVAHELVTVAAHERNRAPCENSGRSTAARELDEHRDCGAAVGGVDPNLRVGTFAVRAERPRDVRRLRRDNNGRIGAEELKDKQQQKHE